MRRKYNKMAKLFFIAIAVVVACAQLSYAASLAEVIDSDLRENLNGYSKILAEVDDAHKADLEKLIAQTEAALKEADDKEKTKILDSLSGVFSEDFNQYLGKKLQELNIDTEVERSLNFYKALLEKLDNDAFKPDIEKAIETLTAVSKETDATKKVESYVQFNKDHSESFREFLKTKTLPEIESSINGAIAFFDNLLAQNDVEFKDEIITLKKQAEEGLTATTLEEKQKTYYEITNPENKELFSYLKQKYIEQQ